MRKTDKIRECICSYQADMDKHFELYKKTEKEFREKYNENGFHEYFINGFWPKAAGNAWARADAAIREVTDIYDDIQESFESFMMKPMSSDMVSALNCISSFGLSLTKKELQILEKKIGDSYWGMKVLSGLAMKNGFSINVPSADEYLKTLKSARKNTELAIRCYAGSGPEYPGKDLLPERTLNGVSMGAYTPQQLYYSENFLHGETLNRLEKMFDSAKEPMVYVLNAVETGKVKEQIEKIVDSNGRVNENAATELLKKEPDFQSKLASMPKSEMENYKTVSDYFYLDDGEKENAESKISTLMGKDKAHGFGQVNQEALKQYM